MPIRPLARRLPIVHKEEVGLLRRFGQVLLAHPVFEPSLKEAIRASLAPVLGARFDLAYEQFRYIPPYKIGNLFPTPTAVVEVSLGSIPSLFMEFDLALANGIVRQLLGGKQDDLDLLRPLTEVEQGMLFFILSRVFRVIAGQSENLAQLPPRIRRHYGSAEAALQEMNREDGYFCVHFRVMLPAQFGVVRCYVPLSFMDSQVFSPIQEEGLAAARLARTLSWVQCIQDKSVDGRALAGSTSLSAMELQHLSEGDILMLDECTVSQQDGDWVGKVSIWFSDRSHGGIVGDLFVADGKNAVMIQDVLPALASSIQEQAADSQEEFDAQVNEEHAMARYEDDDGEAGDEEQNAESSGAVDEGEPLVQSNPALIEEVPVTLSVEVGRLKTTLGALAELRVGGIVELSKRPHDPVDLVVQDKLMAQGELVDVDGQVGVRITRILLERS